MVLAIGTLFVGTLAALFLQGALGEAMPESMLPFFAGPFAMVLVGALGALALGRRALLATFGGVPTVLTSLGGMLAGVLSFLVAWSYVEVMARLLTAPQERESVAVTEVIGSDWLTVVEFVVFPALIEEWLCRGVLWEAVRRATPLLTTLVVTSTLFALLHFFNGGMVFELPHRFAAGMIFGYVRWKSGSLVPGVLAHGVNNSLALL